MKEKSPVEALINVIGDMIRAIQIHQGPISQNLNPAAIGELERLEKAVKEFDQLNKETFKESGVNIEQLKVDSLSTNKIAPKYAHILKRAREIENEARRLQVEAAQIIANDKNKSKEAQNKDSRKRQKDRRNRFKPIGGDKNWMPI